MSEPLPRDVQEFDHQAVANGEHVSEDDAVTAGLRAAGQQLYDAIQGYLIDIPDSQLPPELVAAFDAMEAAWRRPD
jgi:hypothetical protein